MTACRGFRSKLVPALLAVVLVACVQVGLGEPRPTPRPEDFDRPSALTGTEWILTHLQGHPLVEGITITLGFDIGEFRGFASCNQYFGPYHVDGDTLAITEVRTTAVGCGDSLDAISQLDRYPRALIDSTRFQMTGDHLQLLHSNGNAAVEYVAEEGERDLSMEGQAWALEKWIGAEGPWAYPIPGTTIWIQFEDGVVRGNAGCNAYTGSYSTYGYQLHIDELHRDSGTCTELDGVLEQETVYLDHLQRVDWRHTEGRELILRVEPIGLLAYRPVEESN